MTADRESLTGPSPEDVRPDPAAGAGRRLLSAVLAGLGLLVWFAAWGWTIGVLWKKTGLPDYATWGRFYAFWVPASAFLFAMASVAFALADAGRAGTAIVRQVRASFSLLLFLFLAIVAPRGALHVWLGGFLVGSILVRGAALVWPLWHGSSAPVADRAAPLRIFVASALVYTLLVPWIVRTLPVAGDEPHYLLISHSILVDRDLDLRNNYEQADYRSFHAGRLAPQGQGWEPVSAHGVGFPLLILPGYALGGRVGATWVVALVAALLSVNVYWFCLELSLSPRASLQAWALSAFTVPIVTYSHQLFPEIPGALGVLYAYRWFRADPFPPVAPLLRGMVATFAVLFLKVRYAPVALVLWAYLLFRQAFERRWVGRWLLALLAFLIAFPLLDWFVFEGSLMLARFGTPVAWLRLLRPNRFHLIGPLGLLFDQKNGLLMYSPVYLLSFLGLALLMGDRKPDGFVISLVGVVYLYLLIGHAEERWHGEFSPAPRYLVILLPLLSGPMAVALHRCRGRLFGVTRTALAVYSLTIAAVLLLMPRWRYRTKTGQSTILYMVGQVIPVNLIDWFPSFIAPTAYAFALAGIGVALTGGLILYFYGVRER